MVTKYLIDSNAVIDYLSNSLPSSGMTFMNNVINDIPKVSVITKMEVLGFKTPPDIYKILVLFFVDSQVIPLSEEVAEKTIDLRKEQKIKLPDAIIAATALVNDFTLITRNKADFKKVKGLSIIDAHLK